MMLINYAMSHHKYYFLSCYLYKYGTWVTVLYIRRNDVLEVGIQYFYTSTFLLARVMILDTNMNVQSLTAALFGSMSE